MAGGKETPRQKMIGMMYLVLTALLALNVSKSILDAFVAIEENIQISNENEFMRGQEKYLALKEVSEDKTQKDVQVKALKLMKTVSQIDKMTAQRIKFIDDLKLEILAECGEEIKIIGKKESIIFKAYDTKEPLKPIRMKLEHVQGMDKYDEAMRIIIGEDITKPTGKGVELWKTYNGYRKELTELIASSVIVEKGKPAFKFNAPEINKFSDMLDLSQQVDKAIESSKVAQDDKESIKKIYISLTKNERSVVHDVKNVHWIGKTFDHTPVVAALASLSSMQKEILTARADAVSIIRARVGGGEYSFNKIMALAYGPELANSGDEVKIEVLMAAFDSDKQPEVTYAGKIITDVKEGKGIITTKASGGNEMVLNGEITIKNKSGMPKTMPWTKTIKIMKPQGNASLPEMNVLYRDYENKLLAVASGYEKTIVTISNGVSLKPGSYTIEGKQINGHIVRPSGPAKTCEVYVSGQNTSTKKTVKLGSFSFRIKNLPPPTCYFGKAPNGGSALKSDVVLSARYEDSPLNAVFTVVSWELEFMGRSASGNGNIINAQATSLLKQAKPNATASFLVKYKGPDGKIKQSAVVVKL